MTRLRLGSLTVAATLALSAATAAAQVATAGTLDHLACYAITDPLKVDATVDLLTELQPEFRQAGCRVIKASKFCVPTTKVVVQATTTGPGVVGQPLRDDYICYRIKCPDTSAPIPTKLVADQFGQRELKNFRPFEVCVPARKAARPCSLLRGKVCGGACPNDIAGAPTACRFDDATNSCTCEPQACGGKPDKTGQCGGACPDPLQSCQPGVDAAGNKACLCKDPLPPPCGLNPATGTCGGTCPNPADSCVLIPTAAGPACTCQPPVPECQKVAGTNQCGGPCPPGLTCTMNTTINLCRCEPPPQPCSPNPLTGQCGGECPPNTVCRFLGTGTAAVCGCVTP
ncbi:MAG TPA: hypothetical protein VL049_02285 [Candidatus Dormibacteraeota bacterium]|nr:hypothetical protein [Candidatus Dormibacteraeota bacterium]